MSSRGGVAALVAVLIATAAPPSLIAARFEITSTYEGETISNTRVCFSRAQAEGSVIDRMKSGPEVRCVPGDKLLSIPRGVWHFYVESDDHALIAAHPFKIITPRDSGDSDPVNQIETPLMPSAWLDFTAVTSALSERDELYVYVSHDGVNLSPPTLLPLTPGVRKLLVPANMPLVPLRIRGNVIHDVGEEVSVLPGQTAVVTFSKANTVTAVVPYRVTQTRSADALPRLRLVRRGAGEVVASRRLAPNRTIGLFIVRALPRGIFDVEVDSENWTGTGVSLQQSSDQPQALVGSDLVIDHSQQKISIRWSLDPDLLAAQVRDECIETTDVKDTVASTLRLLVCPDATPDRPPLVRFCRPLRTLELPNEASGTAAWPTPNGGVAWIELRRFGVSALQRLDLLADQQTVGAIYLTATRLSGRVTLGGTPLAALVNCGSMTVMSTESTGTYRCWTSKPARSSTFVLSPCDGSSPYTHIEATTGTDQEIDIDIPENLLVVDVTDAKTGEPIEKVNVTLWHGSQVRLNEGDFMWLGETGADGRITRQRLQAEGGLSLCAEREGYERQCRDDFTVEKNERTTASIALTRTSGLIGSIAGAGIIASGTISVVRNGVELDSAAVKADGSFRLNFAPPPDAHIVLTSTSLPLSILAIESRDDRQITLRLPLTVPRTFSVSANEEAPVTLVLGQVLVPVNVFLRHQQLSRQQYYVVPSRPLLVHNVDGSSAIVVVLGLSSERIADPFVIPRLYDAMPKHVLTSDDHVTF